MEKTDKRYQAYIDILREELIPAMGCTEPIAVAYAAAAARNTLGELPDKVLADPSCFYKKGTVFGRTENFQRINWDYSQFTSRSSCPTRIT